MPLLEVRRLVKLYPAGRGQMLRAVDDVSFALEAGETLGLVGESGCGKSTTGRVVARLVEPSEGEIRFKDEDLFAARGAALRLLRRRLQIVFQDPYASLNPRMTVRDILAEPLQVQGLDHARPRLGGLLEMVGLPPDHLSRYPHQLSGGQRQRVGLARALATEPELVVADEPVSALDVSIQAQVVNLMQDLQESLGLSYLFISHDIAVVRHISKRIAVMYLGRLVEMGPASEVVSTPQHPYTMALIGAIPTLDGAAGARWRLSGDVPSPLSPPPGCPFHTRCRFAVGLCRTEVPEWREVSPGHYAACHLAPLDEDKKAMKE